jgi:hypothetical protein
MRTATYVLALSYAACENQVERTYATFKVLGMAGGRLAPPGAEWYSRPKHMGEDLTCKVGEEVKSPIDGRIAALLSDGRARSEWKGVLIEGSGRDETKAVRILGIASGLDVGSEVSEGTVLGIAQNPRKSFKGIEPHVHLEYYIDGKARDPLQLVNERWKDRVKAYPMSGGYLFSDHKGAKLIAKGLKLEEERKYGEAIECFRESLDWAWFDLINTPIYHYLARNQANLKDYESAALTQEIMVGLLENELEYSEGAIPSADLGTIGACSNSDVLKIQLDHQRRNLNAYRLRLDTLFVY